MLYVKKKANYTCNDFFPQPRKDLLFHNLLRNFFLSFLYLILALPNLQKKDKTYIIFSDVSFRANIQGSAFIENAI